MRIIVNQPGGLTFTIVITRPHHIVSPARAAEMLDCRRHSVVRSALLLYRGPRNVVTEINVGFLVGQSGPHFLHGVRETLHDEDHIRRKLADGLDLFRAAGLLAAIAHVGFEQFLCEGGCDAFAQRRRRRSWYCSARNVDFQRTPGHIGRGGMRTLGTLERGLRLAVEDVEDLGVFSAEVGGPAFDALLVLDAVGCLGFARHAHVYFAADVSVEAVDEQLEGLGGIGLAAELDFVNAASLCIGHKGTYEIRRDYRTGAGVGCFVPDSLHETTRLNGKGIAALLGPAVGGPGGSIEEFREGAHMAERLEGRVQITVVGYVAETAMMCWMHGGCHATYKSAGVGHQLCDAAAQRLNYFLCPL